MAIIEINLEKPALVEERRSRGASSGQSKSASKRTGSGGSGGRGKLLGLLAVLAGIGLLVARMRGGGETEVDVGMETGSMDEMDEMDEDATESASGGGMGRFAGALGLVVALASVVAVVLKRRS